MEHIERQPNTFLCEGDHRHIPGYRTLTQLTHKHLLEGKVLTPDLYEATFPEGETIVDRAQTVYDALEEIYEAGSRTENADRLIALFRQANRLGHHTFGAFVGTSAGTFALEVNEILGKQNWLSIEDMDAPSLREEVPYPRWKVSNNDADDSFPWEYYAVMNASTLMHEATTDYFSVPIAGLRRVSASLSYTRLSGNVSAALLERIRQQVDSATYYAERNRLPYKQIALGLADYEKNRRQAAEHIKLFRDIMQEDLPYQDYPRSTSEHRWRISNYDASMRLIMGGYLSFRKAGFGAAGAIKHLYAHGGRFRAYTASVNDAMPFATRDSLTFSLRDICSNLVAVTSHNGEPVLDLSLMEPAPETALPSDMPDSMEAAFMKKRQSAGRCPARHTIASITGSVYKDHISEFSDEIRERVGVDPSIFTSHGSINLTSLIMAMTINQAERLNFFDAVDKRVADLGL